MTDNTLNDLVFLIGPPGSGKINMLKDMIANGDISAKKDIDHKIWQNPQNPDDKNYYSISMINIPNDDIDAKKTVNAGNATINVWERECEEALKPEYKLVIVDHFEYDIKNPASNRYKLAFLEELLLKRNAKVIILSTVHPVNFLDSLNRAKNDPAITSGSPEHELERWHVLLGHFKIAIKQLETTTDRLGQNWRSALKYETRTGRMLKRLHQPILKNLTASKEQDLTADSISLKLGITGHYYYMYVWQSLTKEEKFILFDLAEDGLVNPYDEYNIILLINKGLIVKEDGILRLFNQGFRAFIMTAIGTSEALQIQGQVKDNGNWNKLRLPLILLIAGVLVFLFTSQKDAYTVMIKYITMLGVGIPLVTQLLGKIGSTDSK